MSGHSKWANIQHRKGRQDAKRSNLWTKLVREIIVAARVGGSGDPDMNSRLRLAISKARDGNVPKDTIQNAILKGNRCAAVRSNSLKGDDGLISRKLSDNNSNALNHLEF